MNIPEDIREYGISKGLEEISTGGGVDYMCQMISDQQDKNYDYQYPIILIGAVDDCGSPENLTHPCLVGIWINEEWNEGVTIKFNTTKEAIDFVSNNDINSFKW